MASGSVLVIIRWFCRKTLVVAVTNEEGNVKQAGNLSSDPAVCGSFYGSLIGMILLNAADCTTSGTLTEVRINDHS
jgi:uncharacterized membrane protein